MLDCVLKTARFVKPGDIPGYPDDKDVAQSGIAKILDRET